MDYEKAYKEALEKARDRHSKGSDIDREDMEWLFPELAESEDERIRKSLLAYIKGESIRLDTQKWIAYLEKQIEQKHYWKPTDFDAALFNKAVITNKALTPVERAQLDIIRSKFSCCRAVNCSGIVQKEQKPVFKVGDTIIAKDGTCIPQEAFHIERIKDGFYWEKEDTILISNQDEFQLVEKPSAEWSEEDKKMLTFLDSILEYAYDNNPRGFSVCCIDAKNWLKSIPERFNLQPKQEWGEEEERHLYNAIEAVKYVYDISEGTNGFKCVEFLKSLRSQPQRRNTY